MNRFESKIQHNTVILDTFIKVQSSTEYDSIVILKNSLHAVYYNKLQYCQVQPSTVRHRLDSPAVQYNTSTVRTVHKDEDLTKQG